MTYKSTIELVRKIAEAVDLKGGVVYYVGGCVRDKLMNVASTDYDIEVHGIETDILESILENFGEVLYFGKLFGVYNIKGYDLDIALPRTEQINGCKHTDFLVDTNPFLGTKRAAERRDFTVNSIMQNALTDEICDHFGGVCDIKRGIIRHVNDQTFTEDPLRVFRAAQFAARFNFKIAPETKKLCSSMYLGNISHERVFDEMKKALLKADKPSLFFDNLMDMNCMKLWFPEIEELAEIEQNPKYHPEGNVYIHTMQVLDEVAKRRRDAKNPLGLMLSALVHDLGKLVATEVINGQIHAYAHESKGLPIAEKFLRRITNDKSLISYALNMAELHMKPNVLFHANASVKSTNKMFDTSIEPYDLILLALSDISATHSIEECRSSEEFLTKRLEIYNEYMQRPYVTGRDLSDAGIPPGENYRAILEYAHKLRLAGVEKNSALKQVIAYAKKVGK